MSHPPEIELALLGQIADDLREVFSERGYRVEVAVEADPAFGSGARSALKRDLAIDAVSVAAGRIGVDFRPVNGSGREFRFFDGLRDRRYRFRRGYRNAASQFVIHASSESALAVDEEDDSLFPIEQWLFIWTPSSDGLIGDTVVAEVRGFANGKPGRLQLGPEFHLGASEFTLSGAFVPADEDDLDGFEDDREQPEEGDSSSSL